MQELELQQSKYTYRHHVCSLKTLVSHFRVQSMWGNEFLALVSVTVLVQTNFNVLCIPVTREQHAAEVQNLESMMAATQQMLGQHIAKYKDQVRGYTT